MSTTPSIDQLKRAITISEQIQKLEAELASILGSSAHVPSAAKVSVSAAAAKPGRRKRGLSAEGRARIAAAQKARWAKAKGDSDSETVAAPKAGKRRKKRNLSPEARARIVAAVKARWAKAKKAK
ncbi:conserved hypothetical protein [Chthoniobacter flavus Ellin428]|uniref:Uncharacterized protein n=1 Tax=Chthoniobacter flavus Ellin428 TaxID=497964 RepID=B4DBM0_9BACT|nr:hypothetical protein [Chthoniobacter flavus]EDY16207.1 conserved hypothetical protein [Chthoniobacter flavus Ellin428]TCO87208.1 hypothetical protein EV701_12345 [Chthoniobacter flavus]